jgi:hypothetical protein
MTITVTMTDPAEHQPSELRALAVFLNNLAADREAGRIADTFAHTGGPIHGEPQRMASPPLQQIPKTDEVAAAPIPLPQTLEAGPAAPSVLAPSIPPAPPAADAPPVPNASGLELDANGLPWDGRVHAESKGKIADGTWRKKRGVDQALVTEVEARLRELAAIPAAGVAMPPAVPEVPAAPEAPIVPVVEAPPPAPVTPIVPVADTPPAAAVVTIADVFKFATAAEKARTLSPDARAAALQQLGFNSMIEIGSRPDLAGALIEKFKEFGA